MSDPRHPDLERAIGENPGDRELWAVYADWLSGQGDPRGEIIALELAGKTSSQLYDTPAWLDGGVDARLTWRFGFVQAAELHAVDDAVAQLLASPAGRFVQKLLIHGDSQPAIEALVAQRPRALRELAFGVRYLARPSLGRVDRLWSALPWLRELGLHGSGGTLGEPDAPDLRLLELDVPALDAAEAITAARWPALHTLRLVVPHVQERQVRALARAFWARSLDGLRHLGIIGCDEFRRVGRELVASPLAVHLESLDLTGSRVGTQGARLLAQNRERLGCLNRVVVGDLDQRGRAIVREAGW